MRLWRRYPACAMFLFYLLRSVAAASFEALSDGVSLDDPAAVAYSRQLQEDLKAFPRRALQDSSTSSGQEVTVVTTFQELLEAWTEGAAHIELQAHMDSTGFPLISADIRGSTFSHVLPPQLESTRTVMGKCQEPPGAEITDQLNGVPLVDLKAGQCVILANEHLMPIVTGTVLVDNIYIRYSAPIAGSFAGEETETAASTASPSLFHSHGGKAWVSNMTVQGDGQSPCGAVVVYAAAQLKFIDTDFVSLYASVTDIGPKPTALVKEASVVSYLRTRALNIKQDALVPIYAGDSTVKLQFQECEFENNTVPLRIQVVPGGKVYSDNRTELVWQDGEDLEPVDASPLSEAESSGVFLSLSDPEYQALKNGMPLDLLGDEEEDTSAVSDDDGLSDGAKIGIGVAAACAVLVAAGVVGFWCTRRSVAGGSSGDKKRDSIAASPTARKSIANDVHARSSAGGSSAQHPGYPPHPPVDPYHSSEGLPSQMDGPSPFLSAHYVNASQRDHPYYTPAMDPVAQHGYQSAAQGAAAVAHSTPSQVGSQPAVAAQQHSAFPSQMSINSAQNAPVNMHAFMTGAPLPEEPLNTIPEPAAGTEKGEQMQQYTPPHIAPRQQGPQPTGSQQQTGMNNFYGPGPAPGIGMKPALEHQQFNSNNSATTCAPNQLPMPDPDSAKVRSATSDNQTTTMTGENPSSMSTAGQPPHLPQPQPHLPPQPPPPHAFQSHKPQPSAAVVAAERGSGGGCGLQSVQTYDSIGEVTDICTGSHAIKSPPPASNASMHDKLDFLHCQLDSLRNRQILSGLLLQEGSSNRLPGGQAIVQFATHVLSKVEYAIKFFVSNVAFQDELAQYSDSASPLRVFLPKARDIVPNDDGAFVDARGHPMPPCIVMEKGESLDRWVQRNKRAMDPFTCMQILYHVCECLMDLHKVGYVHRDLKPANIMWLPSQNRWTIIDFGCAAKIDTDARMGFSLMYAAPEVVTGVFKEHRTTIRASTALDAWSVGILAVELFTAKPALRLIEGKEKVVNQIVGDMPLPWEGPDGGRDLLKRAGKLRLNVLRLLQRDPTERLTVDAFVQSCSNMLSTTTQLSAESRDSCHSSSHG